MATRKRDICILGYAEETRDLVRNLPESTHIWGINAAHFFAFKNDSAGNFTPRTKAKSTDWFQLHPRNWANPKGEITGFFGRPPEHMDFLKQFDGTVWLREEDPDIPNGKRFPLEEIVKASGRSHFTSTFAYQLGMAWYQHVVQKKRIGIIHIYGVNLSSIDEYIHQKPCVEYWLGRLEEAGVTLDVPDGSALLKGTLYGISTGGDISDHAFDRLQHYKNKYMEAWANTNTGLSMKAETQFWATKLSEAADKFPDQFTEELKEFIQKAISERVNVLTGLIEQNGAELNGTLGMVKDNQHWLSLTGGIDHRAPSLPELRIPTPQLSGEFEMPEPKSI